MSRDLHTWGTRRGIFGITSVLLRLSASSTDFTAGDTVFSLSAALVSSALASSSARTRWFKHNLIH